MTETVWTVQMDFSRAQAQAAQLERTADKVEKVADGFGESCIAGIVANWKGEGAACCVKKGRRLEQEIRRSAGELRKAAAAIRQIAQNVYEAEQRAAHAARTRTYADK